MNIEQKHYVVGIEKKSDGSPDYSRAASFNPVKEVAEQEEKKDMQPILSEKELQSLSMQLLTTSEFQKNIRLKQIANQKETSPEQILQEIRKYAKIQIRNKEKGSLRHFHRTSPQNFQTIAEMGRLISRSRLKKERPDHSIPGWSSSDDVMMTRDKYSSNGDMVQPGFYSQEVVGASGSGIMLVIKDSIMDREDYDATGDYPTISDLPLEEYCEVILVNSQKEEKQVEQILSTNNLNIPISLKSTWKRH